MGRAPVACNATLRNRASLAKLLLERPDVLLLDEPTNYLDVEGVAWLEGWLATVRGAAVVVVSHDRFFIDKVATRLLVFEGCGQVRLVEGNWTIWQASRQIALPPP